jgi:predicted O-methyltransferase YrrM
MANGSRKVIETYKENADDEILKSYESIAGGTTALERRRLFQLAQRTTKGQIVEIGSYIGGSTVFLAKGAAGSNKKVYAIDPHIEGYIGAKSSRNEFSTNIEKAGCREVIIPLRVTSAEASKTFNEVVGLLFIDGLHTYEGAREDFYSWREHLADDGVIVFHDCWSVGVARVIGAMLRSGDFSNIHIYQSLLWAKKQPASWSQMLLKYPLLRVAVLSIASAKTSLFSWTPIKTLDQKFGLASKLKRLLR